MMHVSHIGADLIYATSYDKPKAYVDELLAEVGRLVMREVNTRASDGTPRYALEIASQRSHSAKHPLMVRGYLAPCKSQQTVHRRAQSAAVGWDDQHYERLYFYRPEPKRKHSFNSGHMRAAQNDSKASARADSSAGTYGSTAALSRPNKTMLLRARSSESSTWDSQHDLLNKGQWATSRHKAKDTDLKLKFMKHEFARSSESLHGFLVGAKYNRSRGIAEELANDPADSDKVESLPSNATARPVTGAQHTNGSAHGNRHKVRPLSASYQPCSTAWTQLHADNPPLYTRPYSSITGAKPPLAERPLSALQKAIVIRQFPGSAAASAQNSTQKATNVAPATSTNAPAGNFNRGRSSTAHTGTTRTPAVGQGHTTNLQVVSQKVVQHEHLRAAVAFNHNQEGEQKQAEELSLSAKLHLADADPSNTAERYAEAQGSDAADGAGQRKAGSDRASETGLLHVSETENLHHNEPSLPGNEGSIAESYRNSPVAPDKQLLFNGTVVEVQAGTETLQGPKRSIHVDVAMLHEDADYGHESDKGEGMGDA